MELRHLTTFAAVAEHRSFTRAAKSLSLTQAAVSQHIAALEREVGQPLLNRSSGTVTPTESGRTFYEYTRRILDLVAEAQQALQGTDAANISGSLRIAVSTVPAESLLPEILSNFRRACPDVREFVTVSDSADAIAAVETGAADVGIVGELPRSSELTVESIGTDRLVLVASPENPATGRKSITLKQLRKIPLIVREPGSGSRRCVERALEAAGIAPGELSVVMEVNSNDAIRAAVIRGMGASFLSESIVQNDVAEDRLKTITVRGLRPERKFYLVRNAKRIPDAPLRAFLKSFHV